MLLRIIPQYHENGCNLLRIKISRQVEHRLQFFDSFLLQGAGASVRKVLKFQSNSITQASITSPSNFSCYLYLFVLIYVYLYDGHQTNDEICEFIYLNLK